MDIEVVPYAYDRSFARGFNLAIAWHSDSLIISVYHDVLAVRFTAKNKLFFIISDSAWDHVF